MTGQAVESWSADTENVKNDVFVGLKDYPGIGISPIGAGCDSNKTKLSVKKSSR